MLASADGVQKLVLDLSELEFIDSMGIHFVVTAHQAAEADGREFTIVRGQARRSSASSSWSGSTASSRSRTPPSPPSYSAAAAPGPA